MSAQYNSRDIFGGSMPWNTSSLSWKAVDDRVRGGSSQSFLDPINLDGHQSAKFYGNLDTKTLGGAGFASRSTKAISDDQENPDEPTWNLSRYDGLLLSIRSADNKTYAVTLKDELPDSRRDDGRERSGISWEAEFEVSEDAQAGLSNAVSGPGANPGKILIMIPWSNFKATYRGRDKPDAKPLDTTNIRRFALMMRSFFTKQDGDFELVIDSISVYWNLEA